MATSKKSAAAAPTTKAAVDTKPVAAAKAPAKKAPAVKKAAPAKAAAPVAEKPAAKPAAKSAAPAKKTATAKKPAPAKAVAKCVTPEQRANYIEVAAFYIAERRGFAPGNPEQDYLDAAAEIDRLIAAGHFSK